MYADADPRWHGGGVSGSPSFLRHVQIDSDRGILQSKIDSGASVLPPPGPDSPQADLSEPTYRLIWIEQHLD
ncbi:unnamed protein product [Urochloa humidicola]